MMATKDNHWIKSDVSVINRESKDRLEWFITDISFIGVALILIGGMGRDYLTTKSSKVKDD